MHPYFKHTRKTLNTILAGFMAIFFVSCGTYQKTGYDNDGIYNSNTRTFSKEKAVNNPENKNNYYQQYFSAKANSLTEVSEGGDIFTDVDAYTTRESMDEDGNIVIEENQDTFESKPGWGDNPEEITINIYPSSYFGGFGYGYGYSNYYYGGYYPWWSSFFYPSFYYPSYHHHHHYSSYYSPYYGSSYYYGNSYYGSSRNLAYNTGRRSRYGISNTILSRRSTIASSRNRALSSSRKTLKRSNGEISRSVMASKNRRIVARSSTNTNKRSVTRSGRVIRDGAATNRQIQRPNSNKRYRQRTNSPRNSGTVNRGTPTNRSNRSGVRSSSSRNSRSSGMRSSSSRNSRSSGMRSSSSRSSRSSGMRSSSSRSSSRGTSSKGRSSSKGGVRHH